MPPDDTLDIMAKYDILVASQPNFTYSLGPHNAAPALSPERLATNNPQKTLIDRNIKLSYGSDGMPTDPRVGIYAAVTRKGEDGKVYGPQEAVSLPDAIRMYTQAPAYLNFLEDERGSITPGKVADFVVLGRDIYETDPEQLMSLPVDMTIVGGKLVYTRKMEPGGPH
jgi:predicted amidohydrolase YtcJ